MKTNAVRKFRAKLAGDEPVYGLWVTLESASVTEMAVGLGLDWVVVDAEHGHLDWKEVVEHVRATVRSDTVALVRVAELGIGLIKRALDIGADGVVVPWMETPEQLRVYRLRCFRSDADVCRPRFQIPLLRRLYDLRVLAPSGTYS